MTSEWKTAAVYCGLTMGGCIMLCLLCLTLVIPILQIAFGATYLNQCPINPNIPIYLIVAGIGHIVMAMFLIFTICGIAWSTLIESTPAAVLALCGGCTSIVLSIIISLFSFIWLILGSVWVFGAKSTVQHDKPELNTYCQGTLYKFAFAIIIIEYILILFRCMQQKCTNATRQNTTNGDAGIDL